MKKIFSSLMLMIIISIFATLVFAEDTHCITRADAAKKIVQALYDYGADAPFDLEGQYCVHSQGGVHYTPFDALAPHSALCDIYVTAEGTFSDVKIETEGVAYIALAHAMGITEGYMGAFRPLDSLTYSEAYKMLICALGYIESDINAPYPTGYIDFAQDLGIASADFDAAAAIDAEGFDGLLKKCINLDGYPRRNMMITITYPHDASECAAMYAEAVKTRRGAIQYALMSSDLQEAQRADFEAMRYVSGASSPFVTAYRIEKTDDAHYCITFDYATSSGSYDSQSAVLTIEENRITQIK